MKNKCFFKAVFFFCFSLSVFSRGKQELIPCGSWIYSAVTSICLEQKIVNFADDAPLSIMELETMLKEIDFEKLSPPSKKLYNSIFSYFNRDFYGFYSDIIRFQLEPALNFSSFFKTSGQIPFVYDYYERNPFLECPLSISAGDFITMKMNLYLGQNKNSSVLNPNIFTNIPFSADQIDINFPDNSYLSAGFKFTEKTGINFQIGNGSKSIGNSLTGSMLWSSYLTGVAYGQFSLYSPNLKYTANTSQFNVDRYMYSHQLDFSFIKRFTFTIFEGNFVNAPMELRFLNPFTIFHGLAPWRDYDGSKYDSESRNCAYLGLKFQFVPVSSFRIYGIFAQTQFQTPYEVKNWPNDTTPSGMGGQIGAEYFLPLKNGLLSFGLEGSYAQPYLYIKESPNWSLVRTYAENLGDVTYPFYQWIGSPYGPDTAGGKIKIKYEIPSKFSVELSYLFLARGEMSGDSIFRNWKDENGNYKWGGVKTQTDTNGWCYPGSGGEALEEAKKKQSLTAPSGICEYVNTITLTASYYFSPMFSVFTQPSFVYAENANHKEGSSAFSFEFAAGCRFSCR